MRIIETKYNGYKFRSRLEARWAVFFDNIGLPFEYEPEGYDLDGIAYLPDFYIPAWDAFVDIKPKKPSKEEEAKCKLLHAHSKKMVLLDRKSTRLNSSHQLISYAVFCLK